MTREAVLFDLFDTLVLFDRSRLPEVRANGKTMRSTAGHLHQAFRPFAPGLELDSSGAGRRPSASAARRTARSPLTSASA